MESIRLFLIDKIKERNIVDDILKNYYKDKYNNVLKEFKIKKKIHYFKSVDTHITYSKNDEYIYSSIYGMMRDNVIFKYKTILYVLSNYKHKCKERVFTTLHGGKLEIMDNIYYENEDYD